MIVVIAGNTRQSLLDEPKKTNQVLTLISVCEKLMLEPMWKLRQVAIYDIGVYLLSNWIIMNQYKISKVIEALYDPEIEVRNTACGCLTKIIPLLQEEKATNLISELKEKAYEKFGNIKNKRIDATDTNNMIEFHGAISGLIAFIEAQSISIMPWGPDVLTFVSKYRDNYGMVSNSVRICLSNFWKIHKKNWEHEKDKFTKEQQESLAEHINPYNYFA